MDKNLIKGLIMSVVAFVAATISDNIGGSDSINWYYVGITSIGIALTYIAKNAVFKSISVFASLDLKDLLSGAILAIGTAISAFAGSVLTTGIIDWKILGIAVLTAVTGYFTKTFFGTGNMN